VFEDPNSNRRVSKLLPCVVTRETTNDTSDCGYCGCAATAGHSHSNSHSTAQPQHSTATATTQPQALDSIATAQPQHSTAQYSYRPHFFGSICESFFSAFENSDIYNFMCSGLFLAVILPSSPLHLHTFHAAAAPALPPP
jgi:hypothetical protein